MSFSSLLTLLYLKQACRLIRAPLIHEFFSGTAQSCRAHARLCCVRRVRAGSERQMKAGCWGGWREGEAERGCAVMPAMIRAVALAV